MIDLWTIPLGLGHAEAALALLDAEERAEYRRHEAPARARAFALRRTARRIILARYLDREPASLAFGTGSQGKPELPGLHFSASHSGDRAILGVSPTAPLGVDCERIRPVESPALVRRALAPAERAAVDRLEGRARSVAVLTAWTAKEAVLKAMGRGLDLDLLPRISVPPEARGWVRAAAPEGAWYVHLKVDAGQVTAIAARERVPVVARDAGPLLREAGLCAD